MSHTEQRSWLVGITFESHDDADPAGPTPRSLVLEPEADATYPARLSSGIPAGRCGKPRANGDGFCKRRVGDHGCPYHP